MIALSCREAPEEMDTSTESQEGQTENHKKGRTDASEQGQEE
uniref:Uncharacterized protein n=1 Tax=Anguilla anguilla TaxID=7936 RepID=A0A0E9S7Y2_ANGAN